MPVSLLLDITNWDDATGKAMGVSMSDHFNKPVVFLKIIMLGFVFAAGLATIFGSGENTDLTKTMACTGPHQYVRTGSRIALDARCSDFTNIADDHDYMHYRWKLASKPADSTIFLSSENMLAGFVADVPGEYEVELYTDVRLFADDAKTTLRITASTGNARPMAEAGPYQEVAIGDTVQLQASGTDADDDSLTYSWSFQPSSESSTLSGPTSASTSFVAGNNGDYTLDLVVNDGAVDSLVDSVLIRSRDANFTLPVAVAGPDMFVTTGSVVNLDAGNSYSAFGKPLSYTWRMMHRPDGSNATLSDITAAQPSFIADVAGAYLVRLSVNDGANDNTRSLDGIYQDRLIVIAGNNQPPVANGGPDHSINTGAVASLDGSASYDPELATLTYQWTLIYQPDGSTASLSSLDTQSTQLSPDRDGNYLVRLVVNDGTDDSAPDIVRVSASSITGGTSLVLQTALPYAPPASEVPTWIQIDTDASDAIRVVSPSDASVGNFATTLEVTYASATEATFNNYPQWTVVAPSSLTISDATTPTFILQRIADGMYYKVVLDFTSLQPSFTVQVDTLQAWRCGTNPADCP
jgi:predicted aspartyl protease